MTNQYSSCPKCQAENIYFDSTLWNCPDCGNEWAAGETPEAVDETPVDDSVVKDAHGNLLATGDTIIVIKDLPIKGSNTVVKGGTKVKKIRLVPSDNGHPIACKIDGIGAINLKPEFVKKV